MNKSKAEIRGNTPAEEVRERQGREKETKTIACQRKE